MLGCWWVIGGRGIGGGGWWFGGAFLWVVRLGFGCII